MRIIALRGDDDCGKTATITLVYDRLLLPSNGGISTNKQQVGKDPRDFSDIVNYKGLTIAFYSMGDISRDTKDAIKNYDTLKVDVLIIASNTKFTTSIKLILKYTNDLVVKTVAIPSNKANDLIANTTDANTIFGMI